MPLVLERFPLKSRGGTVIVLNERAKRGDIVQCGDRSWPIEGVETFCILNPPLPWGYLLQGESVPAVGTDVSIEKGPEHDVTPWPKES